MTPCERLKRHIDFLLDADANPSEKHDAENHLKQCPECAELARRLKRQQECLRHLSPIRTQEHFIILLRERIRREVAGRRWAPRGLPVRQWAPVLGAAAVLIAVAVWLVGRKPAMAPSVARTVPAASRSRAEAREPVHYVIDDVTESPSRPAPAPQAGMQAVHDTSLYERSESLERLRARMAPVSF